MHRVYELQLENKEGQKRVHVYACDSTEEAMQKARELLDREDLVSVEVRVDGTSLFSVTR
ncbi:hypothetical protein DJ017_08380 [Phenylobacterium soli]|uniref:Uncharacterized protein n=2 Tax=Phenylobacterium soli TaxID=2170551 RepID=A0A328AKG3_9CAUL|nr:hypothetical protein DJ017_08380 [Phenylobacterium soli]